MSQQTPETSPHNPNRFWLGVLLALLCLKLFLAAFVFQYPSRAFLPDSNGYDDLAFNLWTHGQFNVPDEAALGLIRTPGYPALIAVFYAMAGRMPGWVILFQIALDGVTALLIWRIGKELFSDGVGLLGAFIYALSLNATTAALYLLTDTLFTFLLMAAFFCIIEFWRVSQGRWLAVVGLTLGLATLVRPIGLYLSLIWIVGIGIYCFAVLRQNFRGVVLMAMVFVVLVVPWMYRNYNLTGRFILSTAEATNLYCCFAPAALAEDTPMSLDQAKQQVSLPYSGSLNKIDSQELFVVADSATQIILQHPVGYIKAHLKGVTATLFEPVYKQSLQTFGVSYTPSGFLAKLAALDLRGALASLSENTSEGILLAIPILNFVYAIAEYGLAIIGAYRLLRSSQDKTTFALGWLGALITLYIVLAPGPGGGLRFRLPAEPFLALFAAIGLSVIAAKRNFNRASKRNA